jgi:hypothetical protein
LKSLREKLKLVIIYNISLDDLDPNYSKNRSNITHTNNLFDAVKTTTRSEYSNNLDNAINNNLMISSSNNTITEPYYTINILLEQFRDEIIEISYNYRYSGRECGEDSKWTFFSSLLFTITLMSTVGFGHVAPQTWEGRVVCVCFATIGIPIYMLCVAHLSRSLKRMIELLYIKLDSINPIKIYINQWKEKRKEKKRLARLKKKKLRKEKMNNKNKKNEPANILLVSKDDNLIHSELAITNRNSYLMKEMDEYSYYDSEESYDSDIDDDNDDDDNEGNIEYDEYFMGNSSNVFEVPLWIAIIIINVCVIGGTILFTLTEEWNIYESFYFLCVTLSTIVSVFEFCK